MKTCMRIKNITFMIMVLSGKGRQRNRIIKSGGNMISVEGASMGLILFALKSLVYVKFLKITPQLKNLANKYKKRNGIK